MALMGRVVGVGAVGDPGGDIVMAAILSFDLLLLSVLSSLTIQNTSVGRSLLTDDEKAPMHKRPVNRSDLLQIE